MEKSNLLQGKVAFITGGAQGIGKAVAKSFIKHGGKTILADCDQKNLEKTVSELGNCARGMKLDVVDEIATESVTKKAFEVFGTVNTVIPNAGILLLKHGIDTSASEFRKVIDVNLTGSFITATVFARKMIENQIDGRIIMTSSLFGTRGGRENSAYSASKFGMIGLMHCLAAELAEKKILVNCVCPGQMETEMLNKLFRDRAEITGKTEEQIREKLTSRIPTKKLGNLDDLAGTYIYLSSELSQYVTGQAITVDGGWSIG